MGPRLRVEGSLSAGLSRDLIPVSTLNETAKSACSTYSSTYSNITVLSFRDLCFSRLFNLRAGTKPFGETSKSSGGFLYGSTSSTLNHHPMQ